MGTSVAIAYPVSYPERKAAHSTMIYLGKIKDFDELDKKKLTRYVEELQPLFPEHITCRAFTDRIGANNHLHCLGLHSSMLLPLRNMAERMLNNRGYRADGRWAYTPHVSLHDVEVNPAKEVMALNLFKPRLWWGGFEDEIT